MTIRASRRQNRTSTGPVSPIPTGPDTGVPYHSYWVPPTFYMSARSSEWFLIVLTDPVDATHTRLITDIFTPADTPESTVRQIVEGAELINQQDIGVATSVQISHETGAAPLSYFMPESEIQLRRFSRYVYQAICDDPRLPRAAFVDNGISE